MDATVAPDTRVVTVRNPDERTFLVAWNVPGPAEVGS